MAGSDRATTSQPYRAACGGLIDRERTVEFRFDGRTYFGHPGDTLASALVANGVRLLGRSFKYHRPRGLLSAGSEEPNALVELRTGVRREPNTRATEIELFDGLEASSQNRWPSLAFDVMSVNQLFGPIIAAGFYYKTFMWPAAFWEKVYEPLIRRAAGLGRAAEGADPDTYEKATMHCDVLVIGGGPAGLAAALAAGRTGARVVLVESDFRLGGSALAERRMIDGLTSAEWVQRTAAELASLPEVQILTRTTVFGVYDQGTYGALERVNDHVAVPPEHQPRQRLWRIVAKRAVLAAGTIERPIIFGDNDRPGVMLASAVRTYANRFAARPGNEVVVLASNDDAVRTLADVAAAGGRAVAYVDLRPSVSPEVAAFVETAGARLIVGGAITRVQGGQSVEAVEVTSSAGTVHLKTDLVAMSGGWSPTLHLTTHLGGKPVWDEARGAFTPGPLPPGLAVAGSAAGHAGLGNCLASGFEAGLAAAVSAGYRGAVVGLPETDADLAGATPHFRIGKSRGKAFVDFQNDVTDKDIELAEREGYRSVEHTKRYTTLGMATDQGKTANVNGVAILAEARGRSIAETGTTTFRPPFTAVSFGAFAGHHRGRDFRPTRLPAAHGWIVERGAVLMETGAWLRPQWFPEPGESDWMESVVREVNAVRTSVGLSDVSTLGKIDVQGPDAGLFLDRLYTNTFSTLAIGRARYGLMLREDGFVFDDGTTSRLGPEHFLVTTTTAHAAAVLAHMEHALQVIWPDLDVQVMSVTEQWAQYAVAGPKSRDVLARVVDPQHDISNEAFPYMGAGAVTVSGGIPARLFRISFSGELAYELAVPARYGDALVRRLMEAGAPEGITPYGLETLGAMRIEKGHVAGGELNGQTTARDLGLGKMVSTKKDFIGRVMAARPVLTDPMRPTLVGIRPVDRKVRLGGGGHFLEVGAAATAGNELGHMTSVAYSPTFSHWIGLGLLKRGHRRHGDTVRVWDGVRGRDVLVEVVDPCFYDPKGERLRA